MNLPEKVRNGIITLAKEYHIKKVILFGSRARGDNWQRSDIDIAVTGGDITRFTIDIEEEIPTLLLFDVVNLDGPVQPELLESIQAEGITLYTQDGVDEDIKIG